MKVLYIDDIRFPEYFHQIGANITVARSYEEAIKYIDDDDDYDVISLDHDLGEEKTGYDIAKYIVENQIEIKGLIAIHSANPVGRFNIEQLLTRYGYKIVKIIN